MLLSRSNRLAYTAVAILGMNESQVDVARCIGLTVGNEYSTLYMCTAGCPFAQQIVATTRLTPKAEVVTIVDMFTCSL
jgi:hypothetical protein